MTPTQANRVATIRISLAARKAIAHCGDSPRAVKLAIAAALRSLGEIQRDAPVGRRTADLWLPSSGVAVWVATAGMEVERAGRIADALACRRPGPPALGVVFVVPAAFAPFKPAGIHWPLPVSIVNQPRQEEVRLAESA